MATCDVCGNDYDKAFTVTGLALLRNQLAATD
jgi:hypothetical protein